MKDAFLVRLFAALGGLVLGAASASGETTLLLEIGFGVRDVLPSRVTVPAGEYVQIVAPDFGPLQWIKNGQAIPGAAAQRLIFTAVSASRCGRLSRNLHSA